MWFHNGMVNSVDGKTIKVKNLTVTSSSIRALNISYGSTLISSGNVKVDSTNNYVFWVEDGTVAVSGNIEITTSGHIGLWYDSTIGKLSANNITATCDSGNGSCFYIAGGTVTVTNTVSVTGGCGAVSVESASLTAKKIIGTVGPSDCGAIMIGIAPEDGSPGAIVIATESILGVGGDKVLGGVVCSEGATITSPMIYYYPKKNISCTVNGTVNCRSGSTCTN